MKSDLTSGNITKTLLFFAGPMIAGNLLQQIYSIADTLIVGCFLGENALAAVGSTYTLTTFLYSIIIGLCMGSGALVSYYYGEKNFQKQKTSIAAAFILIGTISVAAEMITLGSVNGIITLLKTPPEIMKMTEDYVQIILSGIIFTFLYNYYAYLLRAFGNSVTPLIFLGAASVLHYTGHDFCHVSGFGRKRSRLCNFIGTGCLGNRTCSKFTDERAKFAHKNFRCVL